MKDIFRINYTQSKYAAMDMFGLDWESYRRYYRRTSVSSGNSELIEIFISSQEDLKTLVEYWDKVVPESFRYSLS